MAGNLDPHNDLHIACTPEGWDGAEVSGILLTGDEMNAHNTFDNPDSIKPVDFHGIRKTDGLIHISLPCKSVVVLELA